MRKLRRVDNIAASIENGLIIISVTLMIIFTTVQIILRSLYTYGHFQWANSTLSMLDWTEPFSRLLVLWVTFLGASLLTRDNKHIMIDMMSSILPIGLLQIREMVISITAVLISAAMAIASIGLLKIEKEFGGNLFLNVPVWIGQLIIPAGFTMIFFRFLLRVIDHLLIIIKRPST